MTVPRSLGDLTAEWLGEVLRAGGHLDGDVTSLRVDPVEAGLGSMSEVARLVPAYVGAKPGPASLVAKVPADSETNRELATSGGLYAREARFYAEIASRAPVRPPVCYHAEVDGDLSVLLLEDLAHARAGDMIAGCSPGDASAVLDELAALHAACWGRADEIGPRFPRASRFQAVVLTRAQQGFDTFVEWSKGFLAPAMRALGEQALDTLDATLEALDAPPRTINHGDAHLDNIFFPDGERPVLVDWQLTRRAHAGALDLAYFLFGSLEAHARRAYGSVLLDAYHRRLVGLGVTGYTRSDLAGDLRTACLWCLPYVVSGATIDHEGDADHRSRARVERFFGAALELEA